MSERIITLRKPLFDKVKGSINGLITTKDPKKFSTGEQITVLNGTIPANQKLEKCKIRIDNFVQLKDGNELYYTNLHYTTIKEEEQIDTKNQKHQ